MHEEALDHTIPHIGWTSDVRPAYQNAAFLEAQSSSHFTRCQPVTKVALEIALLHGCTSIPQTLGGPSSAPRRALALRKRRSRGTSSA